VKGELIEECEVKGVDLRGIDPGQEVLQILANTIEPKTSESTKYIP
jgi:hypothetical protein